MQKFIRNIVSKKVAHLLKREIIKFHDSSDFRQIADL